MHSLVIVIGWQAYFICCIYGHDMPKRMWGGSHAKVLADTTSQDLLAPSGGVPSLGSRAVADIDSQTSETFTDNQLGAALSKKTENDKDTMEAIYVVKRDSRREPLDGKKVGSKKEVDINKIWLRSLFGESLHSMISLRRIFLQL